MSLLIKMLIFMGLFATYIYDHHVIIARLNHLRANQIIR